MNTAPSPSLFPDYPAAWYLFGTSNELRNGPASKTLLGKELVAFRSASGSIGVLDAKCSHMSANLGRGKVVGDCVQCPFHHWEYTTDGICNKIPSQFEIPSFARQRAYPVVERHGLVFIWNGNNPTFELPFFAGENQADFERGRPFHFIADCSWFMLVANGFDGQHFQSVHDRRLLGPPKILHATSTARAIEYHAEVVGDSIFDKLLKRFVGKTVRITIANHGGTLVLVTGHFQRATSYILIAVDPRTKDQASVQVVVFAPKPRNPLKRFLSKWLGLELRRLFTKGFMHDDIAKLPGIQYNSQAFINADQIMIDFFQWLAQLPNAPEETFAREQ